MNHNISSASLMTALYFLGLSMQYSIEQTDNDVEEENSSISPEKFAGFLKKAETNDDEKSDK